MMEESIGRELERWARGLLLVGDGVVRKLTESEVEIMAHGGKTLAKATAKTPATAAKPSTRRTSLKRPKRRHA